MYSSSQGYAGSTELKLLADAISIRSHLDVYAIISWIIFLFNALYNESTLI